MTIKVEVTDVRLIHGDGKLKAFADVLLEDRLLVGCFTVTEQGAGVLAVFPPRKATPHGTWFDILSYKTKDDERAVCSAVLEAYQLEISK